MGGALLQRRRGRLPHPSCPLLALPEKLGELHRWPGTGLHLALDRAAILAQDLETAAAEIARLHIHQNLELPWLKRIAFQIAANYLREEPLEAVEHYFKLNQVVG